MGGLKDEEERAEMGTDGEGIRATIPILGVWDGRRGRQGRGIEEGGRTPIPGVWGGRRRRRRRVGHSLGRRGSGVPRLWGGMCIWGVRIQMTRVRGLVGGVMAREMVVVMIMAAITTSVAAMTIVAGGDNVEGEESGGEIEKAGGAGEVEEAEEIGVSEETEVGEIGAAEEAGEAGEAEVVEKAEKTEKAEKAERAEKAEGHGVVKGIPTKRQTHTAR